MNVAPRIGFGWHPRGDAKTALEEAREVVAEILKISAAAGFQGNVLARRLRSRRAETITAVIPSGVFREGTVNLVGDLVTTGATNNAGTGSTGGAVTIDTANGTIAVANITSSGGAATAVVIRTGDRTYFGSLAAMCIAMSRPSSAFPPVTSSRTPILPVAWLARSARSAATSLSASTPAFRTTATVTADRKSVV